MGLSIIISSIIGMNFFYVLIDGSFSINFHYNHFFYNLFEKWQITTYSHVV